MNSYNATPSPYVNRMKRSTSGMSPEERKKTLLGPSVPESYVPALGLYVLSVVRNFGPQSVAALTECLKQCSVGIYGPYPWMTPDIVRFVASRSPVLQLTGDTVSEVEHKIPKPWGAFVTGLALGAAIGAVLSRYK